LEEISVWRMNIPPQLTAALQKARRVAVLTGAGVSAESGVPTFRDAQTGLWANYRPEELATPEAFLRNPRLVWDWYAWRRQRVDEVQPNPGHFALAEMETHLAARGASFTLITQNVDGLHQRAGSQNVIELHGNIRRVKCFEQGHFVETWDENAGLPPHCPHCGSLLRPDVVWFGELLSKQALNQAYAAARECDVFFSIGTSGLVQPAASLPLLASKAKAMLVEINPQETPLTNAASVALLGKSGEVLPELIQAVFRSGYHF
jgi:NAD-dependent deacetylase